MSKKTVFNGQTFVQRDSGLFVPRRGQVVVSSAGVGKTWLGSNYDDVLDLDPINFSGSADFPFNYVDAALDALNNYDVILMAFFLQKVRDQRFPHEYVDEKLGYITALPKLTGLEVIRSRMIGRGDSIEMIKRFMHFYPIFIEKFGQRNNAISIPDGQYLEDVFLRHEFITPCQKKITEHQSEPLEKSGLVY